MEYIQLFILGIIQGITEFLPISSSGHLILFQEVFGLQSTDNFIEIFAHFGTLIAIFIFFNKKLWQLFKSMFSIKQYFTNKSKQNENHHYLMTILIATIPTAIIGLFFKKYFEQIFNNINYVAGGFFITTFILIFGSIKREKLDFISFPTALIIGLAQSIAIFPGLSRSGITIIVALLLGIKFKEAFTFSFFISIPPILGASLLKFYELIKEKPNYSYEALFLLMLSATVFGHIALKSFKHEEKFNHYAKYTSILTIFTLLWIIF